MTRSGRSVRDHDWCVWIYEAGVILMAIRLNLILIGVLIAIAYPFLLLRLDNCMFFSIFSVTYKEGVNGVNRLTTKGEKYY